MLRSLYPFQRFILPALYLTLLWALYRIFFKKDEAMGIALFVSLSVITDSYLQIGIPVPGTTIRYSEVLFYFLYSFFYKKKKNKIDPTLKFLLISYFFMYVIAAFRAITLFDGVFTFRAGIVFQILSVIIAFKGFDKPDDYVKVFYYLSFLLFFMGLFVFWDKIFDFVWLKSFLIYKGIYFQNRKQDRFGSFFLNPNFYGAFIVLILLNILSCLVLMKDKKAKAVMLVAALATLYGLVMTRSRGPMISLVLAIVLYLILPNNKFSLSKRLKTIGGVLLLLVIIMPGFYKSATARFTEEHAVAEQDEDAVSRKSMWLAALILVKNHPLFGVGLGEHKYVLAIKQETDYIDSFGETLDNPHNSYLQIATSTGLIALSLFLAINAVIILRGIKVLFKRGSGQNAFLLSGLLPGVIGFLFTSIFDQGMFTMVATLYWIIMGLTYSLTRDTNRYSNADA